MFSEQKVNSIANPQALLPLITVLHGHEQHMNVINAASHKVQEIQWKKRL